jgi:hypothetical protein
MPESTAVELMLVDRAGGWVRNADCGGCRRSRPLPFGLFVGSNGEPCGAVELCAECAPIAERIASRIAELAPAVASVLSGDETRSN